MNNIIVESTESLYERLAGDIAAFVELTIRDKRSCSIALSGGNTPKKLYELLAAPRFRSLIDWQKVFCFFSDERMVPHDHTESNSRMAIEALLKHVPIPANNIVRVNTELSPEKAAADYEQRIKDFFANNPVEFDLILLGLGRDGHTASLFPDSSILNETQKLVASVTANEQKTARISFTTTLINMARKVIFLTTGADKASIVRNVIYGEVRDKYPAQMVQPLSGDLKWYLDEPAASQIIDKNQKHVY